MAPLSTYTAAAACAFALITDTAMAQLVVAPPQSLTFRAVDESGHAYYGTTDPSPNGTACFDMIPDELGDIGSLVPSMCWGPRSMWQRHEETCRNPFARTPALAPIDYTRLDDPNSWWGKGMEGVSGLRMNINLEIGAAPPTMPPRSFDPAADGSPLVPPSPGSQGRPLMRWTRPMLGNSVDIVTGIPMVMETDLELPFGSAVYRHTRTYSEMAPGRHEDGCYNQALGPSGPTGLTVETHATGVAGHFFDWHGQGWMIGESPLFLIDAHYQHVVYNGDPSPRRCYFVVNAHQSIPFDLDTSNGEYVAPPHFDATLEHNGLWDSDSWETRPTVYRVWLYNRTVCYTIRAMYEDVFPGVIPPDEYDPTFPGTFGGGPRNLLDGSPWPATDHASPVFDDTTGEMFGANGLPYWGVVERIDDRYGNCIDLSYCAFTPYDSTLSEPAFDSTASSEVCHACIQPCNEKGQIAFARLVSGAEFDPASIDAEALDASGPNSDVAWTLLYTHRSFPEYVFDDLYYNALPSEFPFHQQTAIHTIHVYEGSLPEDELACRTIPYTEFVDLDGQSTGVAGQETIIDHLDDIMPTASAGGLAVPDTWLHELRYLYAEPDPRLDSRDTDTVNQVEDVQWYQDAYGFSAPLPGGAARLIKFTNTTRHEVDGQGSQDEPERLHTLYRWDARDETTEAYTTPPDESDLSYVHRLAYSDLVTLKAIYTPTDVERILEELRTIDPMPWSVNMLVLGTHPQSGIFDGCSNEEYHNLDYLDFDTGVCQQNRDLIARSYFDMASTMLMRWNRTPSFVESELAPFGESEDFVQKASNKFTADMMANFVLTSDGSGNEIDDMSERFKYKLIVPGVHIVRGADTTNPSDQRAYRVYRFLYSEHDPDPTGNDQHACWDWFDEGTDGFGFYEPRRSIYHEPYRDNPDFDTLGTLPQINGGDHSKVTWVTVIDEYPTLDDAKLRASGAAVNGLQWYGSDWLELPSTRRVITMNAAGWTLSEDLWEFGNEGTTFARTGAREEYDFDSHGRLTEHRTLAWGTAENIDPTNGTPTTAGLINIYEYPPDNGSEVFYEIAKRGFKVGTAGSPLWVEEHTFHPQRPDLPASSTFHALHGTPPVSYVTEHDYEFDTATGDPEDWLIKRRTTLGPQFQVGFGAAAGQYRPQQTQIFSIADGEKGRLEWKSYGLEHISGDARYATRYFDHTHYDSRGRISRQVVDLAAGESLGEILDRHYGDVQEDAIPGKSYPAWVLGNGMDFSGGRVRPSTDSINPALHNITKFLHKSWGVWIHETPQGPEWADGARQTWTFRPLKVDDVTKEQRVAVYTGYDNGPVILPRGQVTILGGERANEIKQVLWDFTPSEDHPYRADYTELVDVDVKYDAAGRPTKVEATGWNGDTVSAEAETDHFGGLTRERKPDGTVTRTVRDPFGRTERVFIGVQEEDMFWGYPSSGPDDLVLTEQRRYGFGRTNIHQAVMRRHFRDRPTRQYDSWDWPGEGWVEWPAYDNKLREIWNRLVVPGTEIYDADGRIISGDSLRTRVTIYDNLDRVMLVAEYGDDAPPPPDEFGVLTIGTLTLLGVPHDGQASGAHVPDLDTLITAILGDPANNPQPLSISGTVYNDAGLVVEQRQYETDHDDGQIAYLSTTTHYDGQGRPIIQAAPNTAPVINNYDALGRLIVRRVVRNLTDDPPFEIQRTETEYDTEGKALVVRTFERLHDDPGSFAALSLANSNCVVTTIWNWYDDEGHLIATADFGSGNAVADQFRSTGDVPDYTNDVYNNPPTVDSAGTVSRDNTYLPNWAVIRCYHYDTTGKKSAEAIQTAHDQTAGTHTYRVNTFQHDDLGNLALWIENATGTEANEVRKTAYLYEHGRVVKIAAVLPGHTFASETGPDGLPRDVVDWTATDGSLQITYVDYQGMDVAGPLSNGDGGLGARVWTGEDEGQGPVWSHNKSWPAAVYFPHKTTGQPDLNAGPDLEFTYYTDGLVRSRIDRLGREFIHHYDEQGQRLRTEISYPAGLFPTLNGTDYTPADLADLLVYTYDERGRLVTATAGKDLNGDEALDETNDIIITQNQYEYDVKGGLKLEYQAYGELVDDDPNDGDGVSPAIEYGRTYADASTGNHHRLTSMTYPPRTQAAQQRTVDLLYLGDIDDALSRITRISDSTTGTPERAVDFAHSGSSRRVARDWLVDSAGSLTSVFGQTFDTTAADGYDGLDRHGRVADLHFAGGSTIHRYQYGYDSAGNRLFARVTQQLTNQDRSSVYAYDPLGRLIGAEHGEMHATDPVIEFTQALIPSRISWGLDTLGNWTEDAGSGTYQGRVEEEASSQGVYDQHLLAADHASDLRNELTGITSDDGSGPDPTTHVHDAAGNLVADGTYYYQYDAFNRLAAVYEQDNLGFDADGIPNSGDRGDRRASYTYDALGRRVSKQVPFSGTSESRWTWYYYDGVRRVQEVHRDPLLSSGIGGNPTPAGSYVTYTDREYVWGPGYVDECLWQVDRTGAAAFVLQDANYNVVALIDETGSILQQFDYTPYGRVLAADSPGTYANNRIGFQGLFVDRYDADAPVAEMVAGAKQTYYARNRDYSPDLGRWVQRDPNGSAASLIDGPISLAPSPISTLTLSADALSMFRDGVHLYQFVGSSPGSGVDPDGRFTIPGLTLTSTTRMGLATEFMMKSAGAAMFLDSINQAIAGQQSWLMIAAEGAVGLAAGPLGKRGMDLLDEAIMGHQRAGRAALASSGSAAVTLNRAFSGSAEDFVQSIFGGGKKYFDTSLGKRFMDNVADNVAREVKTGTISLSAEVRKQVLKDAELLAEGHVTSVEWLFFTGRTGNVGRPTGPLEALLREKGIEIRIMGGLP